MRRLEDRHVKTDGHKWVRKRHVVKYRWRFHRNRGIRMVHQTRSKNQILYYPQANNKKTRKLMGSHLYRLIHSYALCAFLRNIVQSSSCGIHAITIWGHFHATVSQMERPQHQQSRSRCRRQPYLSGLCALSLRPHLLLWAERGNG